MADWRRRAGAFWAFGFRLPAPCPWTRWCPRRPARLGRWSWAGRAARPLGRLSDSRPRCSVLASDRARPPAALRTRRERWRPEVTEKTNTESWHSIAEKQPCGDARVQNLQRRRSIPGNNSRSGGSSHRITDKIDSTQRVRNADQIEDCNRRHRCQTLPIRLSLPPPEGWFAVPPAPSRFRGFPGAERVTAARGSSPAD